MAVYHGLGRACTLLVLLVGFATCVAAKSFSFIQPTASANGGKPVYTVGEQVNVVWTSDFVYTTLKVWQGPRNDGQYDIEVLAANLTSSDTSFVWSATSVGNADTTYGSHFELLAGHDPTCENCTLDSVAFEVQDQAATGTTLSSSIASTSSLTITPISSASSTSTLATATSAASSSISTLPTTSLTSSATTFTPLATPSAPPDTTPSPELNPSVLRHHHSDVAIPLGVCLGLGIPIVAAIIACCCLRRRRQQTASKLPSGRQTPPRPASVTDWCSEQVQQTQQMQETQQRPRDPSTLPSRQRQADAPYRSLTTRESVMTVGSSSSSFFEPFYFERPGSADFDVLSELPFGTPGGSTIRLAAIHEVGPNWPPATPRP